MRKILFVILCASFVFVIAFSSDAALLGTYYNHVTSHPDMQRWITGRDTGYVEGTLSGNTPTLSAYGESRVLQWDWWDSQYQSFTRVDSDADLQSNFASSWFPVNEGLNGDPYYFAVHWEGRFYVDTTQSYTYSMGSDDDSWLFIDDQLVLDLGGVHGVTYADYTISLTQGYHDIDIFFAERHTTQSGFQLNFFSDLEPVPIPPAVLLFGSGLAGLIAVGWKNRKR